MNNQLIGKIINRLINEENTCPLSYFCSRNRKKHLGISIIWGESLVTPLTFSWCTSVSTKCASFLWSWQLQHTQRETIMAHLCHLHVVNINRLGLCVPAPRQSHITLWATFTALKRKPGLLSYCQNIFNICKSYFGTSLWFFLPFLCSDSDQIHDSPSNHPSSFILSLPFHNK